MLPGAVFVGPLRFAFTQIGGEFRHERGHVFRLLTAFSRLARLRAGRRTLRRFQFPAKAFQPVAQPQRGNAVVAVLSLDGGALRCSRRYGRLHFESGLEPGDCRIRLVERRVPLVFVKRFLRGSVCPNRVSGEIGGQTTCNEVA